MLNSKSRNIPSALSLVTCSSEEYILSIIVCLEKMSSECFLKCFEVGGLRFITLVYNLGSVKCFEFVGVKTRSFTASVIVLILKASLTGTLNTLSQSQVPK